MTGSFALTKKIREMLYDFKKHMPVYVITATHDWCCDGNPRRYEGENVFHDVETVAPEQLHHFYKDFGPDEALSEFHTHQDKVSYVVRPCEGVTVFCLDDDQNGEGGSGYSDEHFKWITEQTEEAKNAVISCLVCNTTTFTSPSLTELLTARALWNTEKGFAKNSQT